MATHAATCAPIVAGVEAQAVRCRRSGRWGILAGVPSRPHRRRKSPRHYELNARNLLDAVVVLLRLAAARDGGVHDDESVDPDAGGRLFRLTDSDGTLARVVNDLLQLRDNQRELSDRARLAVLLSQLATVGTRAGAGGDEKQRIRALVRSKAQYLEIPLKEEVVDRVVSAMTTAPKRDRGGLERIAAALAPGSTTTIAKIATAFRDHPQTQGRIRDPQDAKLIPFFEHDYRGSAVQFALRVISDGLPSFVYETLDRTHSELVSRVLWDGLAAGEPR
jgi:hypothetical protein